MRLVVSSGSGFLDLHPCVALLRGAPCLYRAREELGWSPTVPLEEGLRSTVAWSVAERQHARSVGRPS